MNPKTSHQKPGLWKGFLKSYILFSKRHRFLIVGLSIIASVLCGYYATHLRIDANLDALLPRDTETIRAMHEAKARLGSSDLYTIAIVMNDPVELAHLQDRLADSLRKWPDVVYAQVARDNSFFRKHALLYLPQVQLKKISEKIEDLRLDLGKQGPLTVDLFDDEPQPTETKSKREWFDADLPQQLGLPDEAAESFSRFLKKDKTTTDKYDAKEGIPDSLRSRLMGRTRDGRLVGIVQASLSKPSSDFDYVKTVVARSEALLNPVRAEYGSRLKTGVEGPYKELAEVSSLASNGLLATIISVGLNILIIAFFFRGLGSIIVIFLQAVISCLVTLALTMSIYGHLNLYTAFVVSILFGMGIDFSIYVLGYALRLVREGKDWTFALSQTLNELFYSLLVAASTTVAGLLTLLASKFVGFYEFGVQASAGIVVSLVGVYLLMPAYVFATESLGNIPGFAWLKLKPAKPIHWPKYLPFTWKPNWKKITKRSAYSVLVGAVLLAFFIPRLAFEYDFSKLRDTRGEKDSGLPVSVALGSNRTSSQPVVVMAHDSASMAALQDTLLRCLTVKRDPYLRSFLTLSTFVPPAQAQQDRLVDIHHISELISARVFDRAKGDDSAMIANLRELTQTNTFGPQDIPSWALNLLRERDGSYGRLGFIYGRYNSSNALDAAVFQEHYGHLTVGGEKLSSFSSSFVFSDIIHIVKSDIIRVSFWMILVLILLLAFIFRDWRLLTACIIQMVVGLVWILGLMGLFGLKIGPFNLIVITTLQGYAVDVASYMLLGYLRLGRYRIGELYHGIGSLVAVSTLTTTAGYAGMLFTSHMGIASIGKFAVLGLLVLLGTSMCLTPWLAMQLLPEPKHSED